MRQDIPGSENVLLAASVTTARCIKFLNEELSIQKAFVHFLAGNAVMLEKGSGVKMPEGELTRIRTDMYRRSLFSGDRKAVSIKLILADIPCGIENPQWAVLCEFMGMRPRRFMCDEMKNLGRVCQAFSCIIVDADTGEVVQ